MRTYNQFFSGFFQIRIVGINPFRSNVNLNQEIYRQPIPIKPITPLVKDLESHGPSGARSKKV